MRAIPVVPSFQPPTDLVRAVPSEAIANGRGLGVVSIRLSFSAAFGVFGLPLLLATMIGVMWTVMLLAFTIDANRILNNLMNTSNLDNGLLWSIPELHPQLRLIGSVSLILTGCCYLLVMLDMLVWRKSHRRTSTNEVGRVLHAWRDFTHLRGSRRKHWNLVFKCADLGLQVATLLNLHKSGIPPGFVYVYATFIAASAWTRAVLILWPKHSALTEVVIDSMFGSVIVVAFPLSILVFAYRSFTFDRATFAIYEEVLPFGSFERRARAFIDPVEISTVRNAVEVLRSNSLWTMFLRLGMNILFAARIDSVVSLLVREGYRKQSRSLVKRTTVGRSTKQVPIPRPLAVVLIVFGTLALINSHVSITAARAQCKSFPACIAYRYTWISSSHCYCISFVDVDKTPKTFDEWVNPVDVTDQVKALAAAGELRNIQIINRKLREIPDELQSCSDLRILSLVYTGIEYIPEWASTSWTNLEFLHIEGKQGQTNIRNMPSGLFDRMSSLMFLHLGVHKQLDALPSLAGASSLHALALAHLFRIEEIPSLAKLTRLVRVELTYLATLRRLPDLSNLHTLQAFSVFRSSYLCCDGFMGACDLANPYCVGDPDRGIPAATCLDREDTASSATMAVLERFAATVCFKVPTATLLAVSDAPTRALSDECGGVPYRQCQVPLLNGSTITGMCYNNRMQVLSCTADPAKQRVRRLQIARGAGARCDPTIESWLGCGTFN